MCDLYNSSKLGKQRERYILSSSGLIPPLAKIVHRYDAVPEKLFLVHHGELYLKINHHDNIDLSFKGGLKHVIVPHKGSQLIQQMKLLQSNFSDNRAIFIFYGKNKSVNSSPIKSKYEDDFMNCYDYFVQLYLIDKEEFIALPSIENVCCSNAKIINCGSVLYILTLKHVYYLDYHNKELKWIMITPSPFHNSFLNLDYTKYESVGDIVYVLNSNGILKSFQCGENKFKFNFEPDFKVTHTFKGKTYRDFVCDPMNNRIIVSDSKIRYYDTKRKTLLRLKISRALSISSGQFNNIYRNKILTLGINSNSDSNDVNDGDAVKLECFNLNSNTWENMEISMESMEVDNWLCVDSFC